MGAAGKAGATAPDTLRTLQFGAVSLEPEAGDRQAEVGRTLQFGAVRPPVPVGGTPVTRFPSPPQPAAKAAPQVPKVVPMQTTAAPGRTAGTPASGSQVFAAAAPESGKGRRTLLYTVLVAVLAYLGWAIWG